MYLKIDEVSGVFSFGFQKRRGGVIKLFLYDIERKIS